VKNNTEEIPMVRLFRSACLVLAAGAWLSMSTGEAAVLYSMTQTVSGTATVTFSRILPTYLTVGEALTFAVGDITATGGGIAQTLPDPLVLTQNATTVSFDDWSATFNPGILIQTNPVSVALTAVQSTSGGAALACNPGAPCNFSGNVLTLAVTGQDQNSGLGSSAFGGVVQFSVTEVPNGPASEVPEPSTMLLGAAGFGVFVLRRLCR
jgi:hypothetical protein